MVCAHFLKRVRRHIFHISETNSGCGRLHQMVPEQSRLSFLRPLHLWWGGPPPIRQQGQSHLVAKAKADPWTSITKHAKLRITSYHKDTGVCVWGRGLCKPSTSLNNGSTCFICRSLHCYTTFLEHSCTFIFHFRLTRPRRRLCTCNEIEPWQ